MRQACATAALSIMLVIPGTVRADCAVFPSELWTNIIEFPGDDFLVQDVTTSPGWVKFTVQLCDPFNAYFQNGHILPTHYDFGTQFIQPIIGATPEEFDEYTLFADSQEFMIGAVIYPPLSAKGPVAHEVGIQLIRNDPLSVEAIVEHVDLIADSIAGRPAAYYFPTLQQVSSALADRAALEAAGISISSTARWARAVRVCAASCPADLDGTCVVDQDDIVAVILAWGSDGQSGGDSNGDGVVDVDDLMTVIIGYGACDSPE